MVFDQTVLDLLDDAVRRYRDRPAFTSLGITLSFGDVDRLSRRFAAWLQQCSGLEVGDRVAVQLPNLIHYPVVVYGVLRAGMVVVNTNPMYTATEVQHQLNDSEARLLVTMSGRLDAATELLKRTAVTALIHVDPGRVPVLADTQPQTSEHATVMAEERDGAAIALEEALAASSMHDLRPVALTPDSLALLQYTGGTTGVAKGAMLSHRNLVANTHQVSLHSRDYFRPGEECYVAPLPIYHIYAFLIHCVALPYHGGHSILIPDPRNIPALVEAVRPFRFTGFPGINTLFAALCHNDAFRQLDFSALNSTSSGGMALSEAVARCWRELTGVLIAEGYGMTETSPIISANPPGRIQPGTVGIPIPDTDVKVIDANGEALPSGESGELCVRGPQVMQGYWRRPEETAAVLTADGWLHTGDVAVIQADGYVRIVDRIKDLIVVSGFNVYPSEVEAVALMHPDVRECVAIAAPSSHSGETVRLLVVTDRAEFDAESLRTFMREQLAPYKIPSLVEVVPDLPKSSVGKVLRRAVRAHQ